MDKAKKLTTPLKKRIRDSLDKDEPWNFVGFDSDLSLKEQQSIIETALQENQKKHEKFRQCHLELEEAIRAASYAYEYASENSHLRIGKKPKLLEDKFDGPDVYLTIGSMALELSELPLTIQSKIDSEKASVQMDFNKYKYSMQNEMNRMK